MITALIIIGCILIALLIAYLIMIAPRPRRKKAIQGLCVDYAHRGLHGDGAPENSLEAFRRAVEAGFGIELDVRQSADGTLYVFHDDSLSRMCGVDKKFIELHDSEIDTLRLSGSEHKIPQFDEVLALVDGKVPLLVELKGAIGDKTLCPAVAPVLDAYKGPYCVESFNSFLIQWFKKNRPGVVRGQLYTYIKESNPGQTWLHLFGDSMMMNTLSRPDFIAYNEKNERLFFLQLCLRLYRPFRFVWTTRSLERYNELARDGKLSGQIFENFSPDAKRNH